MMQYATAELRDPIPGGQCGAWGAGGQGETQIAIGADFRPSGGIMSAQSSNGSGGGGRPRAPPPVCTKWVASVGPCRWVRCDAHRISEWVTVTSRTVEAEGTPLAAIRVGLVRQGVAP